MLSTAFWALHTADSSLAIVEGGLVAWTAPPSRVPQKLSSSRGAGKLSFMTRLHRYSNAAVGGRKRPQESEVSG